MSVETSSALTDHARSKRWPRAGVAVLLVITGVLAGTFVGNIVWQDEANTLGDSGEGATRMSPFEDYALRHGPNAIASDSATQLSSLEDYALRHGPNAIASDSATQLSSLEDYALRHPSQARE